MADSLDAALPGLKKGIEDAKKAARDSANVPTDQQDPETIIDTLATDLAWAIHDYTISAQVVTKVDIASGIKSTDAATDANGATQEDGGANSVPADSQGGVDKGLTGLDGFVSKLQADIKNAYMEQMTAGQAEVQDTEMAEADKTSAIEALIYSTLADLFCTAVYDYIIEATVKTTVTVEGGVAVSGGIHTAMSSASQSASGVDTAAVGVTEEYTDAFGVGVGDKGVS